MLGRPKFRRWVSSATATDFVDGFQEAALVSDDPPPSPPRLSPDPDAPGAFPPDRQRAERALLLLETEARPPQSKPLKGRPDLWAFRAGTYRLLYRIDDNALEVLVVRIAHRREVYRRL